MLLIKLAILAVTVLCLSSSLGGAIYYIRQRGIKSVFYALIGGKKGPLKSRDTLKCLTVSNDKINNTKNYLGMFEECNVNNDKQYVEYGCMEELRIGDYCLNILSQNPNSIGFSLCDGSLTQKWNVKDDGTIVSALDNKCLNNDVLRTSECIQDNNNNMSQKWIF